MHTPASAYTGKTKPHMDFPSHLHLACLELNVIGLTPMGFDSERHLQDITGRSAAERNKGPRSGTFYLEEKAGGRWNQPRRPSP